MNGPVPSKEDSGSFVPALRMNAWLSLRSYGKTDRPSEGEHDAISRRCFDAPDVRVEARGGEAVLRVAKAIEGPHNILGSKLAPVLEGHSWTKGDSVYGVVVACFPRLGKPPDEGVVGVTSMR